MSDAKKKVLIVDDSALMRGAISKIIRKSPHLEVCGQAGNGKEALEMLPKANPDLIITDVEMPVMDGLAFLKLAKLRTKVPVLVLSSISTAGSETSREAKRLGAAAVVSKPSGSVSLDLEKERENFLPLIHSMLSIH
jgi:chemotaxis response regulator CheB